jgi:hypothetical protein
MPCRFEAAINMEEVTIDTKALPEALFQLIRTEKVALSETDGEIRLRPVPGSAEHIEKLRGSLKACRNFSVDGFLERKRADKELDF